MSVEKKLNVAVVGLGFGSCFMDIYLKHPNVASLTICDANDERLKLHADRLGDSVRVVSRLEELLEDPDIDAIHLNSGIPDHARQSAAILNAGKHCACTVPMATSLDDIRAVITARRNSGKNYMMMETQLYAREYLFVCEMRDRGEFGPLQMLRGAHYQDMENWPPYWAGLPPMWYATHAIGPCLGFAKKRAVSVRCLGSGYMRDELKAQYNNPFPMETAIFQLENDTPLAMEITRALFYSARGYEESFNIYGEDATFEAGQLHDKDQPVLFRQGKLSEASGFKKCRSNTAERIYIPDYASRLPQEIAHFTGASTDARGEHPSVKHGGGHGGSHPHLVHEFISSILENRKPVIDEILAADITAAGICAHESALKGGEIVMIPSFK